MTTHSSRSSQKPSLGSKFEIARLIHNFYLNTAILMLSILLLGLALWTQHHSHRVPVAFAGYSRGTTVSMGNTLMRVDSVSTTMGSGIFAAPQGKHYLIVELTVKNLSEKPINVFPSSDTYLKDPNGNVTYLTPYSLMQPLRAGELSPGEQIRGQLSFLVSTSGTQKLYIDAIWSGGVVPFVVQ